MPATRVAPKSLRASVLALAATLSAIAMLLAGNAANATPSKQEMDSQIKSKSLEFNKLVEQYDKGQTALGQIQSQVSALQVKLKPLQDKVDAATVKVDVIASTAYRTGRASTLNAILNSNSPDSMLESVTLLELVTKSQTNQIKAVNVAKSDLDKQKKKLDAIVAQQTKQQQELGAKKTTLDKDINSLKQLRTQAYGSPDDYDDNQNYGPPPHLPGSAGEAVDYAWGALGKKYEMNAEGPNAYDCSGLTKAAWRVAGYSLPHNAAAQHSSTAHISRADLAPGDLIFYYGDDHVGIYIGGGMIIHAPTYGEPVKKERVDAMPITGYGRVH